MEITIDDKLYRNISDYCEVNQLDFCVYINKLLKDSFMIDKYGDSPFAKAVPYEEQLPSNEQKISDDEPTKEELVDTETDNLKETLISLIKTQQKDGADITIEAVKNAIESAKETMESAKETKEAKKSTRKRVKKEEKNEDTEPQVDSEPKIKEEPKKVLVKRRVLK
jgi:hypothetical protein